MTNTYEIDIDEYDATRPLGLPLSADVQGVLWRVGSATALRVPHEALVGDVAAWLLAEADHRASEPSPSAAESLLRAVSPQQRGLAGMVDGVRLRELSAICAVLGSGDRLHPDLPLGIYARVAAEPWCVDSPRDVDAYVKAMEEVTMTTWGDPYEAIDFLLDIRGVDPRLYVTDLLRAHTTFAGRRIVSTVVSQACLQTLASSRRITEAR